jgi:DNA-directed RNA polymerase sigma subunit (sigma70/sigma32)
MVGVVTPEEHIKQAELLTRIRAICAQRDVLTQQRDDAIREALAANVPMRDVAASAGLTRQRIDQIKKSQ